MKGMCYQEVQRHSYTKVRSYQVAKVMDITNVTSQLLLYISRIKKTHKNIYAYSIKCERKPHLTTTFFLALPRTMAFTDFSYEISHHNHNCTINPTKASKFHMECVPL